LQVTHGRVPVRTQSIRSIVNNDEGFKAFFSINEFVDSQAHIGLTINENVDSAKPL